MLSLRAALEESLNLPGLIGFQPSREAIPRQRKLLFLDAGQVIFFGDKLSSRDRSL